MRLLIRLPAAALALGLSLSVARAGDKDAPPPPPPPGTGAAAANASAASIPTQTEVPKIQTPAQFAGPAGELQTAGEFAGPAGELQTTPGAGVPAGQRVARGQSTQPQGPPDGQAPAQFQGPEGVEGGPGPAGGPEGGIGGGPGGGAGRGIGGAIGGRIGGVGPRAGFGSGPAYGPACPEPCYVEKCVTRFRSEWRERDVPCTTFRDVCKTVTVPETYTVMVPCCREETRCETVITCRPKKIERDVTYTKQVRICVIDPCTGCHRYEFKPEVCTRHECYTVVEKVPVTRQHVVKVPYFRPEVRTRQRVCQVHERVPVTIVKRERYCVQVPYLVTIKVPVCKPVAVACCTTVCKPVCAPVCRPACYRPACSPCR